MFYILGRYRIKIYIEINKILLLFYSRNVCEIYYTYMYTC